MADRGAAGSDGGGAIQDARGSRGVLLVFVARGGGRPKWRPLAGLKGKKGLSFISNRQRRKEGTLGESQLAGIEPTPPAPEPLPTRLGAGYDILLHCGK